MKIKLSHFTTENQNLKGNITRITTLENAIDFILNNQLHLAPLSCFEDRIEGMTFKDALFPEDMEKINIPIDVRRNLIYASCWHHGDEKLHMWKIFSEDNYSVAIQIDLPQFLKKIFYTESFEIKSSSIDNFDASSFHCGLVDYVDLGIKKEYKNKYIARFKHIDFSFEQEFRFLLRQNNTENPKIGLKDLKIVFDEKIMKKLNITLLLSPYMKSLTVDFIKKGFKNQPNVIISQSKFSKLFS